MAVYRKSGFRQEKSRKVWREVYGTLICGHIVVPFVKVGTWGTDAY